MRSFPKKWLLYKCIKVPFMRNYKFIKVSWFFHFIQKFHSWVLKNFEHEMALHICEYLFSSKGKRKTWKHESNGSTKKARTCFKLIEIIYLPLSTISLFTYIIIYKSDIHIAYQRIYCQTRHIWISKSYFLILYSKVNNLFIWREPIRS